MKQWIDKIKTVKRDQLLILFLIGLLLLVITVPSNDKEENNYFSAEKNTISEKNDETDRKTELENQLEQLLRHVAGVGEVQVMLMTSAGEKKIVEKDYTKELHNSSDQVQNNEEEKTVYERKQNGEESPFISEIRYPEIEGILIAAQGAEDMKIVNEITEAAESLFGIPVHKIKVMKME